MKIVLISTEKSISAQGIRTISSYLKEQGFRTKMIFLPTFPETYEDGALENIFILCKDADLIGISCTPETKEKAEQVVKKLKPLNKPIVWGGLYATINPDACIKHTEIVCIGEGEEAISELAQKLSSGKDITRIRNLWVRKGDKIHKNPQRNVIKNLDDLPAPDYSLNNTLILEDGVFKKLSEKHIGYGEFNFNHPYFINFNFTLLFHSSRGCPFSCSFCNNSFLKKVNTGFRKVRFMSPEKIIEDILSIKRTLPKIDFLWFTDDIFFTRSSEEIKKFSKLYRKHISLPFQCYANPKLLTEEKLKSLSDAGLIRIRLGIQTGSDRLNRYVYKRDVSREDAIRATCLIQKYLGKKEIPEYQFITRCPYETEEDVLETFRMLKEIQKPFDLQVFPLIFLLGTDIYKKALSDRIIDKNGNYMKGFSFGEREEILYRVLSCMEGRCDDNFYSAVPAEIVNKIVREPKIPTAELIAMLSESEKHARIKKTRQGGLIIDIREFDREAVLKTAQEFTHRCQLSIEPIEDNLLVNIETKNMNERKKTETDFLEALVRNRL